MVVKGEKGGGSYNVRVVRGVAELRLKYREIAERERHYAGQTAIQEFIAGPTYLFGGLFQDGDALRMCAHRKVLMYPPGQGATVKAITQCPQQLLAHSLKAMKALRFTGLGSLDFILDGRDGRSSFWRSIPGPGGRLALLKELELTSSPRTPGW